MCGLFREIYIPGCICLPPHSVCVKGPQRLKICFFNVFCLFSLNVRESVYPVFTRPAGANFPWGGGLVGSERNMVTPSQFLVTSFSSFSQRSWFRVCSVRAYFEYFILRINSFFYHTPQDSLFHSTARLLWM